MAFSTFTRLAFIFLLHKYGLGFQTVDVGKTGNDIPDDKPDFSKPKSESSELINSNDVDATNKNIDHVLSCPTGRDITTCKWASSNRRQEHYVVEQHDHSIFQITSGKMTSFDFDLRDMRLPKNKAVLIIESGEFDSSPNKNLTMNFNSMCYNYEIMVCFEISTTYKDFCHSIYVGKYDHMMTIVESIAIPANAIKVEIFVVDQQVDSMRCRKHPVTLTIFDFQVINDIERKLAAKDVKLLTHVAKNLKVVPFQHGNQHDCVKIIENLFYTSKSLNEFFTYPANQWLEIQSANFSAHEEFARAVDKNDVPKHVLQMTPSKHRGILVSNPVPCLARGKHPNKMTLTYWASYNVKVNVYIIDHVTHDVITQANEITTESTNGESFLKRREFLLPNEIDKTFEVKIDIHTENEFGFFILKSLKIHGKACKNPKSCDSGYTKSISKYYDMDHVLPCKEHVLNCHWSAKNRLKSTPHAFDFHFPTKSKKKCGYKNMLISPYFHNEPNRKLSFTFTSSQGDYLMHVCFAKATQEKIYDKETYKPLYCKNHHIEKYHVGKDNVYTVPVDPEANRIFITFANLLDGICGLGDKISIHSIKVESENPPVKLVTLS